MPVFRETVLRNMELMQRARAIQNKKIGAVAVNHYGPFKPSLTEPGSDLRREKTQHEDQTQAPEFQRGRTCGRV